MPSEIHKQEVTQLSLADPEPFGSFQLYIIIKTDSFGSCLFPGQKQGILGTLTAQNIKFGWIVSGPLRNFSDSGSVAAHISITEEVHHAELSRFWEVKEPPLTSPLTEDEIRCEEYFCFTCQQLPSGQYMVRLSFKNGPPIDMGTWLDNAKLV